MLQIHPARYSDAKVAFDIGFRQYDSSVLPFTHSRQVTAILTATAKTGFGQGDLPKFSDSEGALAERLERQLKLAEDSR